MSTSMKIGRFRASIVIDGKELVCYHSALEEDGRKASCWIASEANKVFSIVIDTGDFRKHQLLLELDINGVHIDRHRHKPHSDDSSISLKDTITKDGVEKTFMFTEMAHGPDGVSYESFGSIDINIYRAVNIHRKTREEYDRMVASENLGDPESLLAVTRPPPSESRDLHTVALVAKQSGSNEESDNELYPYYDRRYGLWCHERKEKIAAFSFHYRPLGIIRDFSAAPVNVGNLQHDVVAEGSRAGGPGLPAQRRRRPLLKAAETSPPPASPPFISRIIPQPTIVRRQVTNIPTLVEDHIHALHRQEAVQRGQITRSRAVAPAPTTVPAQVTAQVPLAQAPAVQHPTPPPASVSIAAAAAPPPPTAQIERVQQPEAQNPTQVKREEGRSIYRERDATTRPSSSSTHGQRVQREDADEERSDLVRFNKQDKWELERIRNAIDKKKKKEQARRARFPEAFADDDSDDDDEFDQVDFALDNLQRTNKKRRIESEKKDNDVIDLSWM